MPQKMSKDAGAVHLSVFAQLLHVEPTAVYEQLN